MNEKIKSPTYTRNKKVNSVFVTFPFSFSKVSITEVINEKKNNPDESKTAQSNDIRIKAIKEN